MVEAKVRIILGLISTVETGFDFMTSSQQRQLSKLIGSHKSAHLKFATRVNKYIRLNIVLRVSVCPGIAMQTNQHIVQK